MGFLEGAGAFLLERWSDIAITIFTAVVTLIAILTYRDSVKGPNISIVLEPLIEVEAKEPVNRTHPPEIDYHQYVALDFPLVFSNTGPVGGAVTELSLLLANPARETPTIRDGVGSVETIDLTWRMGKYSFQPDFYSGRKDVISVKDNESIAEMARVELVLRDKDSQTRTPEGSFKKYPYFEFRIRYKVTASKGKIESREKLVKIRPKFVP